MPTFLPFGGGTGAETIYALRNDDTLAKSILDNIAATGQSVRKYYQRRLPSDTSKDYYFIHRNTANTQPVVVEYGFVDDTPANVKYLTDNYKSLGEAVVKALADYTKTPYISPSGNTNNTYTVKSGDSLYSIAKKYNLTVNELKSLNNLTSNLLNVGQVLNITPEITIPPANTYTVKSGDSLYKIANKYNTTVNELKNLNNLTSNLLNIGQVLTVPILDVGSNLEVPITSTTYTVQKGDSLYKIANKYNTTVNELKSLNNLTSNLLSIGQILKVPLVESQNNIYVVKAGDNLYAIARKYNTTVATLKSLNNLSSDLLSVGQILLTS